MHESKPREAVIVEAVRTPVGRRGGALKEWHPVDLLARTLQELVARTGLDPRARRRRDRRLRHAGRRAELERGAQRGARRRISGVGSGHDDRTAVRVLAAGGALRGSGSPQRRLRYRDCLRRRIDVARSVGGERCERTRPAFRSPDGRTLPPRARTARDQRRDDRRALGADARGARRVQLGEPPARGSRER